MDKLKVCFSVILFGLGLVGFYTLVNSPLVLRVLLIFLGIISSLVVFRFTRYGEVFFGFVADSVLEARKVVWPSRAETIHTSVVVFVLVAILAIFLSIIDIGFTYVIQWIMGRSI